MPDGAPTIFPDLPREPLVSVCVPVYNAEQFVREAVTSILAQTYRRTEVLLIDDGSTDQSPEIIRRFSDSRIRLLRNDSNLGGYQTMNRGIELATGDVIAIYHADDVYSPAIVEREVEFLQREPTAGAVFSQIHMTDSAGRRQGTTRLPAEFAGRTLFNGDEIFSFLLRRKNILLCCPTFMARRQTLAAVGPFDADRYHVAADLDMWIRILRHYPIGILDEPLMSYRRTQGQWSQRYKRLRTAQELHFEIMDHYLRQTHWREHVDDRDLLEHEFHRVDDQTFRAANAIMLDEPDRASALLKLGQYPWRSLLREPSRRKVRVLLLRSVLRGALLTNTWPALAPVLRRTE